ncbi:MAG: type II 3-dehydroquinate dehydratase [Acidimicrobiia bacterium]
MKILVINGPNLNLLGEREPEIYGKETLNDCIDVVKKVLDTYSVEDFQSNSESEIIDQIQNARNNYDAIIINAGAFTHYSYAIRDALSMFEGKKIEVHLSNPHAREEFRHISVISAVVDGVIAGFKKDSYELAAIALKNMFEKN